MRTIALDSGFCTDMLEQFHVVLTELQMEGFCGVI